MFAQVFQSLDEENVDSDVATTIAYLNSSTLNSFSLNLATTFSNTPRIPKSFIH